MSKLETSENTEDNEGNLEKPEIVHTCDSYGVVPSFPTWTWSWKAWLQYPVKWAVNQQKAIRGCSHMLILSFFLNILEIIQQILEW